MSEILVHCAPRVDRRSTQLHVKNLEKQLARYQTLYEGGTVAEEETLAKLTTESQTAILAERLASVGRRIDLEAILQQKREDNTPRWIMADPRYQIGGMSSRRNGCMQSDLTFWCGGVNLGREDGTYIRCQGANKTELVANGIVPLPPKVRALVSHDDVVHHARVVGVLYQPEGWMAPRPDPALVVMWNVLPGRYYALAVWGQDRPGIMEFVD